MAKLTNLKVSERAKAGKGAARATRRAGQVPGVVYGGKQEPELLSIDPRVIMKELHRGGWKSRLYSFDLGGKEVRGLIRDIQFHPVTDAPISIDFLRLVPGQKVNVEVAVVFTGEEEAPGIKRGGVLNVARHSVDVHTDVDHIPEHFTADLSKLDINDNVRWDDLQGTEHSTPTLQVPNFVIASIAAPTVDAVEEQEAAEDLADAQATEKKPAEEA
ncbi:50S ribosomal protein L25/general stress protein Ctc [Oecophyllibacter saccharovorans]|uniref:Large ribosomal subunit protein bL25 n=1 Tax=Oecophyllibacter saccharovorans TaxID=2558360 RepID=A0A506UL38_9PROT|nr:50S ribosomal protein L25/general stress protein Ctc [Oecophyllibacter saccharovorans]QDH15203.1 50S ribosomal protein L25/general stress protein Ctc [Oecophyllibacter saccharovorans]TPW33764.1 50S ribosomal protein L25/general stress protein Ctc [Oecophyllibacter saccharovorans]TPW34040.1 50S ribosomal protein L25/general stress protein Ctc [Oecophyllibacter saccharovorans]